MNEFVPLRPQEIVWAMYGDPAFSFEVSTGLRADEDHGRAVGGRGAARDLPSQTRGDEGSLELLAFRSEEAGRFALVVCTECGAGAEL